MAITTLDGVIAGMQPPRDFAKSVTGAMVAGKYKSLYYLPGAPGAGAAPAAGIGGELLTNPLLAGNIPYVNPGAGNSYLARFQAQCTIGGTLLLCDRLWQNSGINATLTTEQVFTASAQIPARDQDGTNAGKGVYGAVEVSATMGAATPTLTLKYTNQTGTAGRTAVNIQSVDSAAAQGQFYPIGLQAGDLGIQKAESLTLSASWLSGTIHTILYRVLARLELQAQIGNAIDALTGGFTRIFNDSNLFLVFLPNTTTSSNISGSVLWTQG